jgi:REP element-mobilizing transposase RayT
MSYTYCSALFHCVFSTSERRMTISPEVRADLWAYMGGIAREHGMKALAVGGIGNHVHVLLALPATMPIADAMRTIRSVSSRWLREEHGMRLFSWQEGYGAFSIGAAQIGVTIAYIERQEERHSKRDFQQEFLAILKKHAIEYDPRYVWG